METDTNDPPQNLSPKFSLLPCPYPLRVISRLPLILLPFLGLFFFISGSESEIFVRVNFRGILGVIATFAGIVRIRHLLHVQ